MKLENLNDQLMATAAHRYCLGRQSYIVGACIEWLYATWDNFDRNTQRVIVRDTIEALMDEKCGSKLIDEPAWRDFVKWAFNKLNLEDAQWVRSSIIYKDKSWWPI